MTAGSSKRAKLTSQNSTSNKRPPIEKGRWAAKGTKPLPDQATVTHILSVMVIHICRKVLFIATEVKITLYSISLFFGSLVCDFLPIPRTYMSSRDNFLNLYFVKIGWAWTSFVVGSFIYLTSITYGCGRKEIVRRHMLRLLIGTVLWYFWSQVFFDYVERSTGTCLGKPIIKEKISCIHNGFQWHSFDISGHAFLLVYINLLLVEEAKAILGWEGIRDLLRLEEHKRVEGEVDEKTVLSGLTFQEFFTLKENYATWTPYIRILFCGMTVVSLISDVMLACTVIYFHTMPQKVAGGGIAIATWFFMYRFWFKRYSSPGLPGSGLFKYQHLTEKPDKPQCLKRNSSITKESKEIPMFMGMPIYKEKRRETNKDDDTSACDDHEASKFAAKDRGFFADADSKQRNVRR